MMKIIYQAIVACCAMLIVWELFTQKDIKMQIMAGLVVIPLILRVFMIA